LLLQLALQLLLLLRLLLHLPRSPMILRHRHLLHDVSTEKR